MMHLDNKHILIGISGGIAAYKIPELIRLLQKEGAEVRVTTTKHALEFVTELTLRTLSGADVYSDVFASVNHHATEHISLPDWADMMIIAPATANILGKMAQGIADDALTTTFCAMRKPVLVAPAMNDKMYACPATQDAMARLRQWSNIRMLDCAEGYLACGSEGKGRMQEIDVILEAAIDMMTPKDLQGKRLLITAGPTQEKIDPVRFVSNYSTGKMGFAIALAAKRRGAAVTLVSGPTALSPIDGIQQIGVTSALEMYQAATEHWSQADVAILSAAVADFTPDSVADSKLKKQPGQTTLELKMHLTHDIAAELGQSKQSHQRLIGFALETDNEFNSALQKLANKNMDLIVLNSLRDKGAGFGFDTNQVTLIQRNGEKKDYPLLSKEDVANIILDTIFF